MFVVPIDDLNDPRIADFRNVPDPELLRRRGVFVPEGRPVGPTLASTTTCDPSLASAKTCQSVDSLTRFPCATFSMAFTR